MLNNTRTHGLAASAARTFEAGGWRVLGAGNYTGLVPSTTVYYPAGEYAPAQQLARQFRKITRILPAPRGFGTGHLTVVLARNWTSGG